MLRESMHNEGQAVDMSGVTRGFAADAPVPHIALLTGFVEAIVARDEASVAALRTKLKTALGGAGFVDACAVVAAFHGFVRVADAIGIPHFAPPGGGDLSALRAEVGVDAFYRLTAA